MEKWRKFQGVVRNDKQPLEWKFQGVGNVKKNCPPSGGGLTHECQYSYIFLFSFWAWKKSSCIKLQKNSPDKLQIERNTINEIEFEKAKLHFPSDVFTAVFGVVGFPLIVQDSSPFHSKGTLTKFGTLTFFVHHSWRSEFQNASLFVSCLDCGVSSDFDWTMHVLKLNFVLGLYFIFLCFGMW